jgi:3-methylcrotonyl-CoA carboxylase alpha subunit
VVRRANRLTVFAFGASHSLEFETPATVEEEDPSGRLVSPLPGAVIQVLIKDGEAVQKGQALMVIEAMKMEHTISAPQSGTVKRIYFAAGEQVAEGAQLLEFEETAKA